MLFKGHEVEELQVLGDREQDGEIIYSSNPWLELIGCLWVWYLRGEMYERIRTDSILSFLDRTNNQQDKERRDGRGAPGEW